MQKRTIADKGRFNFSAEESMRLSQERGSGSWGSATSKEPFYASWLQVGWEETKEIVLNVQGL